MFDRKKEHRNIRKTIEAMTLLLSAAALPGCGDALENFGNRMANGASRLVDAINELKKQEQKETEKPDADPRLIHQTYSRARIQERRNLEKANDRDTLFEGMRLYDQFHGDGYLYIATEQPRIAKKIITLGARIEAMGRNYPQLHGYSQRELAVEVEGIVKFAKAIAREIRRQQN